MPEITTLTPQAQLWDRFLHGFGIILALIAISLIAWASQDLDPTDTSFWGVALTAAGMTMVALFLYLFSVHMEDWE